jgi:hypothetical protein
MDEGVEAIRNPEELAAVRRQARRVHMRSVLLATVITLAGLAVG